MPVVMVGTICVCVCPHEPSHAYQISLHLTRQRRCHDAVEVAKQGQLCQSAARRGPCLGGNEQLREDLVRDADSFAAMQDVCKACSQLVLALHSSPNPLSQAHGLMPTSTLMPPSHCWLQLHGLHGMQQCPMCHAGGTLTRMWSWPTTWYKNAWQVQKCAGKTVY